MIILLNSLMRKKENKNTQIKTWLDSPQTLTIFLIFEQTV